MNRCRVVAALLLVFCFVTLPTSAGSPELRNILPIAGERGKTIEATFSGARLADATDILFHTPGITADEVRVERNRVLAKLTISPDAPLGEHQLRVVTKTGVSEMLTFCVVDRPLVKEDEQKFGSFDDPQPIEMGTIVLGRTQSEDVDYYAVDLKQGDRLSVQVDGMRLGRGFTDSYLAVLDRERFEIAASDDTALLRQDPFVSIRAPADGRYTIVIRDSGYQGGDNNRYMLHVGSFPRPAAVFPLGGRPGEQTTLRFIGDAGGDFEQPTTLPNRPDNGFVVMPECAGERSPSGHAFRVNRLPNVLETDSSTNNSMNAVKEGAAYEVPVAFNGVIESPGDHDYYKLRLKKNQRVTLRAYASSMGSPLDSVVNVWRVDNNQHVQGNDDQGGPDSVVTFNAPEDGEYYVRVRDHRERGGEAFVYRVEATVPQPSLSTYIHRYDRNRPQVRQAIAVPRGNRFAALVRVQRERVGGDVSPSIEGLPSGVSFSGYGPAGRTEMPVVFESVADAPLGVELVVLGAAGNRQGNSAEQVRGGFHQVTPLVLANPNRTEYYHSTLGTVPVAVTQASPFKIDVVQPNAPLVRGGKMRLKVNVTREGFDGRVRAHMLWRPPGIGATGRVDIQGNKTEAVYEIDANGNTQTRTWPMVVIASADVPGGPVWVSSQLIEIKVEEPFVTATIAKATCIRGEAVDVVVNLQHPREWAGEGEVKLLGLPAHCSAVPVTIAPGQEQAIFRVTTNADTPIGQHKSLMCELTITVNDEPVIHRVGRGGQLRVDRPRRVDDAQARQGGTE